MARQDDGALLAPRWALTPEMVAQLPELPGVFVLWEQEELIYIGHAARRPGLRAALEEHLHGRVPCTSRASHYAWQLSLDPQRKERELLGAYRSRHRGVPRCNRPAG